MHGPESPPSAASKREASSGVLEPATGLGNTAKYIARDFEELLRILDDALASLGDKDEAARASLLAARLAAERGRNLSQRLTKVPNR